MKKFLLVLVLVTLLTGCKSNDFSSNNSTNPPINSTEPQIVSQTDSTTIYKFNDGENICYFTEIYRFPAVVASPGSRELWCEKIQIQHIP